MPRKLAAPTGESYLSHKMRPVTNRMQEYGIDRFNRQPGRVAFDPNRQDSGDVHASLKANTHSYNVILSVLQDDAERRGKDADDTKHAPCLDCDLPWAGRDVVVDEYMRITKLPREVFTLSESSSGRIHIYIDVEMFWSEYKTMLADLANHTVTVLVNEVTQEGMIIPRRRTEPLIDKNWYEASLRQGHTTLRLPWVSKQEEEEEDGDGC